MALHGALLVQPAWWLGAAIEEVPCSVARAALGLEVLEVLLGDLVTSVFLICFSFCLFEVAFGSAQRLYLGDAQRTVWFLGRTWAPCRQSCPCPMASSVWDWDLALLDDLSR